MTSSVEIPLPAPTLAPEAVLDQLRSLRGQIGEVPLTSDQRRALTYRTRMPDPILQASLNVVGALENVSEAIGQPAGDVRRLPEEAIRWTAVEDELRAMLAGVAGANLVRRHRLALIAAQAYAIGSQLARDPAHATLVPHVEEIKRLRKIRRRRKAAAPDPEKE